MIGRSSVLGQFRTTTGWINRRSPDLPPVIGAVVPLNAPRGALVTSLQDKFGEEMKSPRASLAKLSPALIGHAYRPDLTRFPLAALAQARPAGAVLGGPHNIVRLPVRMDGSHRDFYPMPSSGRDQTGRW
jgi:hypothetical protein